MKDYKAEYGLLYSVYLNIIRNHPEMKEVAFTVMDRVGDGLLSPENAHKTLLLHLNR